jgi:hypothetical protein
MGFGAWGLWIRIYGIGFRVCGLGFKVKPLVFGNMFRVQGLYLRF